MKNRPFITGIIAAASPVPLYFVSLLWGWILFFGIGMGVLGYDTVPEWMLYCMLSPLLISPAIGVVGLVHSIVKIKTRKGWLGIVLSLIGLAENAILLYGSYYLGSIG